MIHAAQLSIAPMLTFADGPRCGTPTLHVSWYRRIDANGGIFAGGRDSITSTRSRTQLSWPAVLELALLMIVSTALRFADDE